MKKTLLYYDKPELKKLFFSLDFAFYSPGIRHADLSRFFGNLFQHPDNDMDSEINSE